MEESMDNGNYEICMDNDGKVRYIKGVQSE